MLIRHVIGKGAGLPTSLDATRAGGVLVAMLAIASSQSELGHQVGLVGEAGKQNPVGSGPLGKMEAYRLDAWNWARFGKLDLTWLAPLSWHALRSPTVDVLHVHLDSTLLWLPKARSRVLHVHRPTPTPASRALGRVLDRCDAVLCCSKYTRRQFLRATGYREDRCFTVYNGVDLARFRQADGSKLRRRLNIETGSVVLLYAGALVPEKGVICLVRALEEMTDPFPGISLLIAGGASMWSRPSAYEESIREQARDLPVHFLGVVEHADMPEVYHAADIVVVPSVFEEPFGIVQCEAMAAGRPVVSSDVGGIPEVIADGETGFLTPPADVEGLARAISLLASDRELRERFGEAGRQRASMFEWKRAANDTIAIYRQILQDRGQEESA